MISVMFIPKPKLDSGSRVSIAQDSSNLSTHPTRTSSGNYSNRKNGNIVQVDQLMLILTVVENPITVLNSTSVNSRTVLLERLKPVVLKILVSTVHIQFK
jgi:hypothetical protein